MKMSGDGSHKVNKTADSRDNSIRVKLSSERPGEKVNSPRVDGSRKNSEISKPARCSLNVADDKRGSGAVVQASKLLPKVRYKTSRSGILDEAEFNQNITSWFGEKGFTAMRSFFRASVLNSLQNDVNTINQHRCSELDAVMVILITDYLLKNSQYFTMSVYTNEVLRPLSRYSVMVKNLLQRIGKSQGETMDPVLSKEDVSFILRSLDLNPHSLLGAEILHRYFEGSQNLLGVFMGLLKDNVKYLSVTDRAVRDNDIVAAFSEGLNEEIGKFQYWFSDFNDQFVDVSIKLKKMISMRDCQIGCTDNRSSEDGLKEENALWERVMTIDDSLRRQQEALVKMRDKERRKLVVYAKELEALHKEMNAKLKSIQSYEHFLKHRERRMREEVHLERNSILEKHGRGDYLSGNSENEGDSVHYSTLNEIQSRQCWNVPNAREAWTQKFGETANALKAKGNSGNLRSCSRIMDENLELKSVLREQHLRIEALTKRVAALSVSQPVDWELRREQNHTLRPFESVQKMEHPVPKVAFPDRGVRSSLGPPRNVLSLQNAVRRAKTELGSLKAEKDAMDMQYERLLNNKLSKK